MSDEHYYDIELKQGDLTINLVSDDVYFIARQMDKWFKVLLDDSYVPIRIPETPAIAAPPPQPAPPFPSPAPMPVPEPPSPPVELPPVDPTPLPPEVPVLTPVDRIAPSPIPEPQSVRPVASPMSQLPPEPSHAEPQHLDQSVQNDFEAVMDTLMRDLEKGEGGAYQPPSPPPSAAGRFASPDYGREPSEADPLDFSDVSNLNQLSERSRAATSEDFLLLTAYYLNDFESQERFSLKRVNSQLVKSGLTPVNHSVLETSITKGHLSLIPDMTGLADVAEYALSEAGRQYVLRLFV